MRCPARCPVRCGYRRSTRLLFVTLMGVACLSVTLLLQRIEPATDYFLRGHEHAQAYLRNLPPVFNRHFDFGQFDAADNLHKVGQSDTAHRLHKVGQSDTADSLHKAGLDRAVKDQTNVGEPVKGQPKVGEPVKGQPKVGEPVKGQPKVGEPVKGQPKVGETVKGQPKVGETVKGQLQVEIPVKGELQVVVPVKGGLGNRMFQYASLLGIAHMNNRTPVYNTSSGLNKTFHVTHLHHNRSGHFKVMSERHFASYDPKLEMLPDVNVQCMQYLQSWRYFHFMQADIRREFTFTQPVKDAVAELLHKHSKVMAGKVKVGVHVRGGDLLVEQQIKRGYHVAPLSYVRKAMDFMRHKHVDVLFIFVTQNPGWCRKKFNCTECVVADTAPADVHLGVLASCDHVIMTVGTYGWWGGFLSGGDVVYWWDPKESLHDPPLPVEIRNPQDYYLPSWIPLTG